MIKECIGIKEVQLTVRQHAVKAKWVIWISTIVFAT